MTSFPSLRWTTTLKGPPAAPGAAGAPDSWNRFVDRQSRTLKLERATAKPRQNLSFIHSCWYWQPMGASLLSKRGCEPLIVVPFGLLVHCCLFGTHLFVHQHLRLVNYKAKLLYVFRVKDKDMFMWHWWDYDYGSLLEVGSGPKPKSDAAKATLLW